MSWIIQLDMILSINKLKEYHFTPKRWTTVYSFWFISNIKIIILSIWGKYLFSNSILGKASIQHKLKDQVLQVFHLSKKIMLKNTQRSKMTCQRVHCMTQPSVERWQWKCYSLTHSWFYNPEGHLHSTHLFQTAPYLLEQRSRNIMRTRRR